MDGYLDHWVCDKCNKDLGTQFFRWKTICCWCGKMTHCARRQFMRPRAFEVKWGMICQDIHLEDVVA